jgi:hypothetical protein
MNEAEVEIPDAPLITRPAPELVPNPAEQGIEPKTPTRARSSSTRPPVLDSQRNEGHEVVRFTQKAHDEKAIVDLATTSFVPSEVRIKTSMSLPESLNKLLDAKVFELKTRGFKKITRESVVEDALKIYFGVK